MRFLHTSDWHLGRVFHQVPLLDAQALFLDHVVELVQERDIDAVLIAGDIYDRALPNPEPVSLLSDALHRLVAAGAQVVLTPGNHDSAARLGFAAGLLEGAGVHIRTGLESLTRPVIIGDAAVFPIPYLEPSVAAGALAAARATHGAVLGAALDRVRTAVPTGHATVVMAHAFVAGGQTCDSERELRAGGVDAAPLDLFTDFDYVALGHLHGRQELSPSVHYSGSPLAMSFSEATHRKGSLLVEVAPGQQAAVEFIPAPVGRRLAILRGPLEDLLADPRHTVHEDSWCQAILTDPIRPVSAMDRLRSRFPHTVEVKFEPVGAATTLESYRQRVSAKSAHEVCLEFVRHVRGGVAPSEEESTLLAEALDGARGAAAAAAGEGGLSTPGVDVA